VASERTISTHVCRLGVFVPAQDAANAFNDMADVVRASREILTPVDVEEALRTMAKIFTDIVEDYEADIMLRSVRFQPKN
jgi:hypothetical protein